MHGKQLIYPHRSYFTIVLFMGIYKTFKYDSTRVMNITEDIRMNSFLIMIVSQKILVFKRF